MQNKAYIIITGIGLGNPNLDSQPLQAMAVGMLIAPDNSVISSTSFGANFSYGDSNEKIRENLVRVLTLNDPELDVNFVVS